MTNLRKECICYILRCYNNHGTECTIKCTVKFSRIISQACSIYVTESGKTGLIHTSTEIQFLSISERYTHALPRNTKYLAIDGQVCFYRRLFADAVKPRRCISWSWGALIGLHGVPNCSSRQSGPPLWIVPVHVTY